MTFVFWSFQLKLPYFKSSVSVVSENNRVLPKNIILMYSKIFVNSKFKFSRKCQNKSVCVRRFLRCMTTRICMVDANCETEPLRFLQTSGFYITRWRFSLFNVSLLDLDLHLEWLTVLRVESKLLWYFVMHIAVVVYRWLSMQENEGL